MKTECTECFRNLGVKSRMKIYEFLKESQQGNVSVITSQIGLKQPTVSYHLNEMYKSGLLDKKNEGKEVIYSVNSSCPHDGHICLLNAKNS